MPLFAVISPVPDVVIPPFAVISPDDVIVFADIFAVPDSVNVCPVAIVIPAFAVISPDADIVP